MADEDECTWMGITCSEAIDDENDGSVTATVRASSSSSTKTASDKVVTSISLPANRLTGSLPPELVLLHDSLETLDLFRNDITHDHEDNDWLGRMTNLKNLFYGQTNFVSNQGVPSSIGQLTKLQEFDCSYVMYSGALVGETFAALSNLEYATMSGNAFGSSVPTELVSLSNLEFLYLQNSSLTGDLSFVPYMADSMMIEFWMDDNPGVSGSIPSEIGLVTTLQSFSITNCSLTGTLPAEMSNLPLQRFWCDTNEITGETVTSAGGIELSCAAEGA